MRIPVVAAVGELQKTWDAQQLEKVKEIVEHVAVRYDLDTGGKKC